MSVLRPAPISTERFTWASEARAFVAEASDLPQMGRVYDDACDVGYTLISSRTGREIVVALSDEIRDREGEILAWELRPIRRQENTFLVHVLND